jgi:hypothetical protein
MTDHNGPIGAVKSSFHHELNFFLLLTTGTTPDLSLSLDDSRHFMPHIYSCQHDLCIAQLSFSPCRTSLS